ncbi:MAG: hypothetical protein WCT27_01365 [Patescibacteria group bacterium]|jgi:hypothetical protein
MRKAGSIILLIILVPVTLVFFIAGSLQLNILTADFIKQELIKRDAYAIAGDQLSSQISTLDFGDLPVKTADVQILARQVLSARWLQTNVESILDRSFAWFNGSMDMTLSLPVDLRLPKATLIPGVEELIRSSIPNLVECPKNHVVTELCRVPNMTVAQVEDILEQNGIDLSAITTQLPDSFDLANPVLPTIKLSQGSVSSQRPRVLGISTTAEDQKKIDEQKKGEEQKKFDSGMTEEERKKEEMKNQEEDNKLTEEPKKSFQDQVKDAVQKATDIKTKYHQGLQWWRDALIAYAAVILLFLAINIKGWHRFTRWFGILLLTMGTLPLLASIASKIVLEKKLLPLIHFNDSMPLAIQTVIPEAIRDVQQALFTPILIVSAVLVGLGIAGIIGACFIAKQKLHQPSV